MRPGEVRELRPCDVDRSDPKCWIYRPSSHKMEHKDQDRVIYIGPKGQNILRKYLLRAPTDYCFDPAEAVSKMRDAAGCETQARRCPAAIGRARIARQSPGERRAGSTPRTRTPRRSAGLCIAAGVAIWSPNQLRHTRATEIRRDHGLEASQVILGHSRADVTQVYAERDHAKAREVMSLVG